MSQESNFSFSVKDGSHVRQPLLTVRGDTAKEFIDNIQAIGLDAAAILRDHFAAGEIPGATEQAVQNMAEGGLNPSVAPENMTPATPFQDQPQTPQNASQGTQQTPWGGGGSNANFQVPTCHHGVRQHRSGQSAKGPWKAWFCPSPKGTPDQCAPIWDRDPKYVAPVGA